MRPLGGAVRLLAVAVVVLALGGAAAIVLGATAPLPPQVPLSTASERPVSEVTSAEPDLGKQHSPVENEALLPLTALSSPKAEAADPSSSEPASIDIPTIGVHSEMRQVGLTAQHTLEVPAPGPHYDQAAWYKHSAAPGAVGTAIVVGHFDSARNGPSVFYDIGRLRPGDEILVTRRDDTVVVFTVEAVRRYSKTDFPTELVYGDSDFAALRLITCGGSFDQAKRRYVDNVVVFARAGPGLQRGQPVDRQGSHD